MELKLGPIEVALLVLAIVLPHRIGLWESVALIALAVILTIIALWRKE